MLRGIFYVFVKLGLYVDLEVQTKGGQPTAARDFPAAGEIPPEFKGGYDAHVWTFKMDPKTNISVAPHRYPKQVL